MFSFRFDSIHPVAAHTQIVSIDFIASFVQGKYYGIIKIENA